jgi:hypothetical protein
MASAMRFFGLMRLIEEMKYCRLEEESRELRR